MANRKKSLFPAVTAVPTGSSMDVWAAGVNYQITYDNFITGLGVTGTIVQAGAATGVPVLDIDGTINKIRNLEDGPGVKSSISPENGVTVEHNFLPGGIGADVLFDSTELQPVIRSLVAGDGISIGAAGPVIQISATDAPTGSKVIAINSLADFPTPVLDVITLTDDTVYLLNTFVDVGGNRFDVPGNTGVTGYTSLVSGISSSTSGALFSSKVGGSLELTSMLLTALNGSIMDFDGIASGGDSFHSVTNTSMTCDSIGTVKDTGEFYLDFCFFELTGAGVLFEGFINLVDINTSSVNDWNGVLFDLGTATFNNWNSVNSFGDSTLGTNTIISGLASSGNFIADGRGLLLGNNFSGSFIVSVGIIPSDVKWNFAANSNVPNSINRGYLAMPTNGTATTITAANTPVIVAGSWTEKTVSRFTTTAAGRHTYIGVSPISPEIALTFSVDKAGGGTDTFTFYISKNGVIDTDTVSQISTSSATTFSVGLVGVVTLSTNDYIELWVENNTSTNDLTVHSANFVVVD